MPNALGQAGGLLEVRFARPLGRVELASSDLHRGVQSRQNIAGELMCQRAMWRRERGLHRALPLAVAGAIAIKEHRHRWRQLRPGLAERIAALLRRRPALFAAAPRRHLLHDAIVEQTKGIRAKHAGACDVRQRYRHHAGRTPYQLSMLRKLAGEDPRVQPREARSPNRDELNVEAYSMNLG